MQKLDFNGEVLVPLQCGVVIGWMEIEIVSPGQTENRPLFVPGVWGLELEFAGQTPMFSQCGGVSSDG